MLAIWGFMAAMNLSAAIVIASWAERQNDLDTMRRWGHEWLIDGLNIYVTDRDFTDYPPHSIVMLSPLAAVPAHWAVPVWAAINFGLALIVPYLAIRAARPDVSFSKAGILVLMFLCWGGFRALLQFSLVSLTFGLLSMVLVEKRPIWGGICLGLALMKPQMSLPFLLWAVFNRRTRAIGAAAGAIGVGFALFCLRAGASPVQVVVRYAGILRHFNMGNAIMIGLAQLRPLIALFTSNVTSVDAISISVALVMLAVICIVGFAERTQNQTALYAAPALAGLWSLLTFYHLTYGFLVLLPLAALLILEDHPETVRFRQIVFWVLQLGLMADLPGLWRWFGYLVPAPASTGDVLIHFDRVFMLVLFGCVLTLALRRLKSPVRQIRL